MKPTSLAIFAILLISATIKAAAQADCAGTTDSWCLSCPSTTCTACHLGYQKTGGCAKVETANAKTNCATYNTSQVCTMCTPPYILLGDNSCGTVTATLVTGCAKYRGNAVNAATCVACNEGLYPGANDGMAATFTDANSVTTVAACGSTKPTVTA